MPTCGYPERIAACRVLHQLLSQVIHLAASFNVFAYARLHKQELYYCVMLYYVEVLAIILNQVPVSASCPKHTLQDMLMMYYECD